MDLFILPLAFGPMQIVLVVVVVLLLFGGKKIPELMKGLGGGIKEFKKSKPRRGHREKRRREKINKIPELFWGFLLNLN